jgi:hypothetical protein
MPTVRAGSAPGVDATMNEYHIEHVGEDRGGYSMIYHCPFCGGAAPKSRRESFFATVTRAEAERLTALTSDVKTIADAIARFGTPDDDLDSGVTVHEPSKENQPPKIASYRTLRYKSLSSTADVDFTDYGPERGVRVSLMGKYIGEPKP